MKLLVHGEALHGREGRLPAALVGMAARGHDVAWWGGQPPDAPGVRAIAGTRALQSERPDMVASAGRPGAAGLLLARAAARRFVTELRADELKNWSMLDRLTWSGTSRWALLEPAESERARVLARPDALASVALWPDERSDGVGGPAHADTAFLELAGERLLAASRGPRPWPAVFLDRDGTLIVERGYLGDPEGVELLPGVAEALRRMQTAGAALVVISNQAGIGRGYFPVEKAWATMARLRQVLRAEGVELDAIRFCPHAPDAGCECRKPGTGMLRDAAAALNLSLPTSVTAGDRWLDAAAGRASGGMGVLLRTGYGREEEPRIAAGEHPAPDLVLDDLPALAEWVMDRLEAL